MYSTIIFIHDKQELILWEEMVEIDWDILEDELDRETLDEPDGETRDKNKVWDTLDVAEIELECDLKDHYHD